LRDAGVTWLPQIKRIPRTPAERKAEEDTLEQRAAAGEVLTADDLRKTVGGCSLDTDARHGGYTVPELRDHLRSHLLDSEQYLEIHRMMREWSKEDGVEHRVIFTVPYQSVTQPIELAWAIIKAWLRRMYFPGRTAQQFYESLYAAFYGDGDRHAGLTPAVCAGLVEHAWRCAADLMHEHTGWTGSLDAPGPELAAEMDRIRARQPRSPDTVVPATVLLADDQQYFDDDYTYGTIAPVVATLADAPLHAFE
jgi:hypothetical protein